ncbi:hypothetical protein MHH60_23190 [Paenibacillus sp. FSL H7-0716]|uniref:Uncharacterized protein n=2 Tax=Paenibacillus odorifer TaxID=189426 RepID=A0AB36J6C0_9BACL|nr:hypothetical protein BSK47_31685 [Paenibacillus odorifer]
MKTYNFGSAAELLRKYLSQKVKGVTSEDLEQIVHYALKYYAKIQHHHRKGDDHEYTSRDIKHLYHRILADTTL